VGARCVEAAVPARPGVPLAGVDATVECLVLNDMMFVSLAASTLKLSKSHFEEDAFRSASIAPSPARSFPFSHPLSLHPFFLLFNITMKF